MKPVVCLLFALVCSALAFWAYDYPSPTPWYVDWLTLAAPVLGFIGLTLGISYLVTGCED